jgi:hypothetical protein
MWAQYTTAPVHHTWWTALEAAATHAEGGFIDWRLPTRQEALAAAQDGSLGAYSEESGETGNIALWCSDNSGRWAWTVVVEWQNNVPVGSTAHTEKWLKESLFFVKFVRDVTPPDLCGNGVLDPGETPCNCPEDAGAPAETETDCFDGIDNDCDGLVDGDDPDCSAGALDVASVSPASMLRGTSIPVTITGTGFAGGASVTFENGSGATPVATDVVVVNDTTITATVTVGTGGPPRDRVWDLRVTNPVGSTDVLAGGFTVTP